MSTISDVCDVVLDAVDDGILFAVIDLDSGLLLGVAERGPGFPHWFLGPLAMAAVDQFRGRTITAVERMFVAEFGATPGSHLVREVQMSTERTHHFMLVLPESPDTLLVLLTGRRANIGLGWAAIRGAVREITPLVS